MTAVERALKTHFGFEKFRSQQQENVVQAVMKGRDLETSFVLKMTLNLDVFELVRIVAAQHVSICIVCLV